MCGSGSLTLLRSPCQHTWLGGLMPACSCVQSACHCVLCTALLAAMRQRRPGSSGSCALAAGSRRRHPLTSCSSALLPPHRAVSCLLPCRKPELSRPPPAALWATRLWRRLESRCCWRTLWRLRLRARGAAYLALATWRTRHWAATWRRTFLLLWLREGPPSQGAGPMGATLWRWHRGRARLAGDVGWRRASLDSLARSCAGVLLPWGVLRPLSVGCG